SRRAAELSFRGLLATGDLIARVRDPTTGEILQLWDRQTWNNRANFGVPGFTEDFVGPDDLVQPGPGGATIAGSMRPVFFMLAEFETLFPAGPVVVEEVDQPQQNRWPIPDKEPSGTKQAAAWRTAKRVWGSEGGPPRSLGWPRITEMLNDRR